MNILVPTPATSPSLLVSIAELVTAFMEMEEEETVAQEISAYLDENHERVSADEEMAYIKSELDEMKRVDSQSALATVGLMTLAIVIVLSNSRLQQRRHDKHEHTYRCHIPTPRC